MSADLHASFIAATQDALHLSQRPDNATLLRLYALYKQASEGDASGSRPGFADLVGRAKWDAWAKLQGTAADAAKQQYIDLVGSLE